MTSKYFSMEATLTKKTGTNQEISFVLVAPFSFIVLFDDFIQTFNKEYRLLNVLSTEDTRMVFTCNPGYDPKNAHVTLGLIFTIIRQYKGNMNAVWQAGLDKIIPSVAEVTQQEPAKIDREEMDRAVKYFINAKCLVGNNLSETINGADSLLYITAQSLEQVKSEFSQIRRPNQEIKEALARLDEYLTLIRNKRLQIPEIYQTAEYNAEQIAKMIESETFSNLDFDRYHTLVTSQRELTIKFKELEIEKLLKKFVHLS